MQAIITRNFRDVDTTSPKVLLTNILNDDGSLFRDHCWVEITREVEGLIPRSNKGRLIRFSAKFKQYKNYLTGEKKQTLKKIRTI